MRVIRDNAWIEREYNVEKWGIVYKKILDLKKLNEKSLSRVMSLSESELDMISCTDDKCITYYNKNIELPFAYIREGWSGFVAEYLKRECVINQFDAIIEIGSGTGRNLCKLWLAGGPTNIDYYALEYTTSGVNCAREYSKLEPEFNLMSYKFDINTYDFSKIKNKYDNILIFTCHAIEQVGEICEDLFLSALECAKNVTFINFEPVGWQILDDEDNFKFKMYCIENNYNRNLWKILKKLCEKKKIEINDTVVNFMGINPSHPISIIKWKKINT